MPAVLILFTRMPFGVAPSLAAGLALMATHPLYARPWALHHACRRCLWCGGPAGGGGPSAAPFVLTVTDPRGTISWQVCGEGHRTALGATLEFAARHATVLRVGVLGTVTVSLVAAFLADRGLLGPVRVSDASAFFRLGVAFTVLPLGWLGPRRRDAAGEALITGGGATASRAPLRAPFPLHLAALIGVDAVLWLFRLVGLLWLAQGASHVVERVSRG